MIGDMDSGNGPAANGSEVPYRRYFWLLTGAWTCAVGGSLAWNVVEQAEDRQSLTSHAAQALLEKDLLYREWSILHGGVYVPEIRTLGLCRPAPGSGTRHYYPLRPGADAAQSRGGEPTDL